MIVFAEHSVLPMAIIRMVEIPIQNVSSPSKGEPICEAPDWTINQTSGEAIIDQAVNKIVLNSYLNILISWRNFSNTELNIHW